LKAESEQDQKNIVSLCLCSSSLVPSQNSTPFPSRNGVWHKSHMGN